MVPRWLAALRSLLVSSKTRPANGDLMPDQHHLHLASDSAQLALWEWDMTADRIRTTALGRTLFGLTPGNPVRFADLLATVHPEDRAGLEEAVIRARGHRQRYARECRIVLADGSVRWIALRGQVQQPAGDGEIMAGVAFDVSAAKLAEERFRHLVEVSPTGHLISGADGRIVFANATAAGHFGYPAAALAGRSMDSLLPGHTRLAATLGGGTARTTCDLAGQRGDGGEIALQMTLTRLPGTDDDLLLTSLVDISERKRHEEQLLRGRRFLRDVIDGNPCLIFVLDEDGRFTLANQRLADLHGTTPDSLIGKYATDLWPPATAGTAGDSEERIVDAQGRHRLFHMIRRPVAGPDGKGQTMLGIGIDITARKESELEIERQRNELAHLSRVTMLGELSGSLAHELNQPLAAILANAQAAQRFLAQEPPNLAEVADILADIVADDRHAGSVIQGLRLLLKKGEMRQEPVDLNEAVRAVLKLVRSDLLNAHVAAVATLAPDLPAVRGDRVQLQQVLLNLVANASEAMAGVAVGQRRLAIVSAVDSSGMVRLSVADRGCGIAAGDLERVFEPFVTTKAQGLGLGLAVCRRLVEAHGGRLWAETATPAGACFHFTVPAYTEATP